MALCRAFLYLHELIKILVLVSVMYLCVYVLQVVNTLYSVLFVFDPALSTRYDTKIRLLAP